MNVDFLIDKLMDYYKVYSMQELAKILNISQPAISKWKKTNSINAIKKKSKELGIYDEIFKDFNENIHSIDNLIENRNKVLTEIDLFKNLDFYNYSEHITILQENCKKYDIQTTIIKNKRLLKLFEKISLDAEIKEKAKELENDLKYLLLKYNPLIAQDKYTRELFLNNLEKEIDELEKENKEIK